MKRQPRSSEEEDNVVESKSPTAQIAVLGAGVMGSSLALNLADHGVQVILWNKSAPALERTQKDPSSAKLVQLTQDLSAAVKGLTRPRRLLLMVPAGPPVDEMVERLQPL